METLPICKFSLVCGHSLRLLGDDSQEFGVKRERARDVVLCWIDDRSNAAIARIKGYATVLKGGNERSVKF